MLSKYSTMSWPVALLSPCQWEGVTLLECLFRPYSWDQFMHSHNLFKHGGDESRRESDFRLKVETSIMSFDNNNKVDTNITGSLLTSDTMTTTGKLLYVDDLECTRPLQIWNDDECYEPGTRVATTFDDDGDLCSMIVGRNYDTEKLEARKTSLVKVSKLKLTKKQRRAPAVPKPKDKNVGELFSKSYLKDIIRETDVMLHVVLMAGEVGFEAVSYIFGQTLIEMMEKYDDFSVGLHSDALIRSDALKIADKYCANYDTSLIKGNSNVLQLTDEQRLKIKKFYKKHKREVSYRATSPPVAENLETVRYKTAVDAMNQRIIDRERLDCLKMSLKTSNVNVPSKGDAEILYVYTGRDTPKTLRYIDDKTPIYIQETSNLQIAKYRIRGEVPTGVYIDGLATRMRRGRRLVIGFSGTVYIDSPADYTSVTIIRDGIKKMPLETNFDGDEIAKWYGDNYFEKCDYIATRWLHISDSHDIACGALNVLDERTKESVVDYLEFNGWACVCDENPYYKKQAHREHEIARINRYEYKPTVKNLYDEARKEAEIIVKCLEKSEEVTPEKQEKVLVDIYREKRNTAALQGKGPIGYRKGLMRSKNNKFGFKDIIYKNRTVYKHVVPQIDDLHTLNFTLHALISDMTEVTVNYKNLPLLRDMYTARAAQADDGLCNMLNKKNSAESLTLTQMYQYLLRLIEKTESGTLPLLPVKTEVSYHQRDVKCLNLKSETMDDLWTYHLNGHYELNGHHPENVDFATSIPSKRMLNTVELLFDVWVSALRLCEDPKKALTMSLTWLFDEKGKVRDKFKKLSRPAFALFISMIAKEGIMSHPIPDHCEISAKRKDKLSNEGVQINWVKNSQRRYRDAREFQLMNRCPELTNYINETKLHSTHVTTILKHFSITPSPFYIHDYDKFNFQRLLVYTYQWYVKDKMPVQTADEQSKSRPFAEIASVIPTHTDPPHAVDEEQVEEDGFDDYGLVRDLACDIVHDNVDVIMESVVKHKDPIIEKFVKELVERVQGVVGDCSPLIKILTSMADSLSLLVKTAQDFVSSFSDKITPIYSFLGLPAGKVRLTDTVHLVFLFLLYQCTENMFVRFALVLTALKLLGITDLVFQLAKKVWAGILNIPSLITKGWHNSTETIKSWFKNNKEELDDAGPKETSLLGGLVSVVMKVIDGLMSMDGLYVGLAVASVVALMTGFSVIVPKTHLSNITRTIVDAGKNAHFIGAGLFGLQRVSDYVGRIWQCAVDYVKYGSRNTKMNPEEQEKHEKTISDLLASVKILSTDLSLKAIPTSTELKAQAEQAVKSHGVYEDMRIKGQLTTNMSRAIYELRPMINKLLVTLMTIRWETGSMDQARLTPYHLQLFGASGIGKSRLIRNISKLIHGIFYPDVTADIVYYRSATDHFDGCTPVKFILVMDEADPADNFEKAVEILTLISPVKIHLPMAHLDMKGLESPFNFVISCTNTKFPNHKGFRCIEAYWRRRCLIEVSSDPDVMSDSKFSFEKFSKKFPGQDSMKFPHLTFTKLSSTRAGETRSGPMTYESFVQFLRNDMKDYMAREGLTGDIIVNRKQEIAEFIELLRGVQNPDVSHGELFKMNFLTLPITTGEEVSEQEVNAVDDVPQIECTTFTQDADRLFAGFTGVSHFADCSVIGTRFMDNTETEDDRKYFHQLAQEWQNKHQHTTKYFEAVIEEWEKKPDGAEKYTIGLTYLFLIKCVENLVPSIQPLQATLNLRVTELADKFGLVKVATGNDINGKIDTLIAMMTKECEHPENLQEWIDEGNMDQLRKWKEQNFLRQLQLIILKQYRRADRVGLCVIRPHPENEKNFKPMYEPDDVVLGCCTESSVEAFYMRNQSLFDAKQAWCIGDVYSDKVKDMYMALLATTNNSVDTIENQMDTVSYINYIKNQHIAISQIPTTGIVPVFRATKTSQQITGFKTIALADDEIIPVRGLERLGLSSNIEMDIRILRNLKKNLLGGWYLSIPFGVNEFIDVDSHDVSLGKDTQYNLFSKSHMYLHLNRVQKTLDEFKKLADSKKMAVVKIAMARWELAIRAQEILQKLKNCVNTKNIFGGFKIAMSKFWVKYPRLAQAMKIIIPMSAMIGSVWALVKLLAPKVIPTSYNPKGSRGQLVCTASEEDRNHNRASNVGHKLLRNVMIEGTSVQGLLIRAGVLLVPYHAVPANKKSIMVSIQPYIDKNVWWILSLPAKCFVQVGRRDLCMIFSNELPEGKDYLKYFMTEEVLKTEKAKNVYIPYKLNGVDNMCVQPYLGANPLTRVTLKCGEVDTTGSFHYEGVMPVGSSGAPVINFGAKTNNDPGVIMGIQSYHWNGLSYCARVSREDLMELIDKNRTQVDGVIDRGRPLFVESGQPTCTALIHNPNVTVLGRVPLGRIVRMAMKTQFVRSCLYGIVEVKHIPAILNVNDSRINTHPLQRSVNKYRKNNMMPMDAEILQECVQEVIVVIRALGIGPCRTLDIQEAIKNYRCAPHIDLTKSPGLPWVLERGGEKGKYKWIKIDEDGDVSFIDEKFLEALKIAHEQLCDGVFPDHSCVEFAKDELRPIRKALGLNDDEDLTDYDPDKPREPNTRSITVMDMVYLVLYRQWHLDFYTKLQAKASLGLFEYSVGIDIESMAARNIYMRAAALNDEGIDGDVKAWDGSFTMQLMNAVCDVEDAFYPQSNRRGPRTLNTGIMSCVIQLEDMVLRKNGGLISGYPGTTHKNTLGHMLLSLYIWKKIMIENNKPDLLPYKEKISLTATYVYGDDIFIVPSKEIVEFYNADSISKGYNELGYDVTSSKKDGGMSMTPLKDMVFLKRNFVQDEIDPHYIRAPMEIKTINNLLSYVRKSDQPVSQFYENCKNAMFFLADHGETVFNNYLQLINDRLRSRGQMALPYTYMTVRRIKRMRYYQLLNTDYDETSSGVDTPSDEE